MQSKPCKKHINTKRYLRKGRRQQSAEEKRKVEEKRRKRGRGRRGEGEGEISVRFSRARVYARVFQPQCCFFAVTSVTRREKIGEKSMEKGEI